MARQQGRGGRVRVGVRRRARRRARSWGSRSRPGWMRFQACSMAVVISSIGPSRGMRMYCMGYVREMQGVADSGVTVWEDGEADLADTAQCGERATQVLPLQGRNP